MRGQAEADELSHRRCTIVVFLDVEDIDACSFENALLAEIGRCEHFLMPPTGDTARELGAEDDWATKDLERPSSWRRT